MASPGLEPLGMRKAHKKHSFSKQFQAMARTGFKQEMQAIVDAAVFNEKSGTYTANVNGNTYTFKGRPEEFLAASVKAARSYPAFRFGTLDDQARRRQKALLWLWDNLTAWHTLEAAYSKIADKVARRREISRQVRDMTAEHQAGRYCGRNFWDDREKLLQEDDKIRKALAKFNEKHVFLEGYTLQYLYSSMPENWKAMAIA